MIPIELHVRDILQERYQAGHFQLRLLADGGKFVYHVQRADGTDWVVRAYDAEVSPHAPLAVAKLIQIFSVLNAHHVPAEHVILSRTGASTEQQHPTHVLVTSYLGPSVQAWQPTTGQLTDPLARPLPTPSMVDWSQVFAGVGALLGQLHAVPPEELPATSVPPADMLPAAELGWVTTLLTQIDHPIPEHLHGLYQLLRQRVATLSRFESCPQGLIHSDPHIGNTVLGADGTVRLTDWESAGLGAAVTDLGALLSGCLLPGQQTPDVTAIRAAVRGYRTYRGLTADEHTVLVDAIQLRSLTLLAACFDQHSRSGYDASTLWFGQTYERWLDTYHLAPSIAAYAADVFQEVERTPR